MVGFVDIVGYLAALLGTFLLLPQLLKTLHTKRVQDLSLAMLVVYLVQCVLWGIYGVLIASVPIVLCNAIAFCIGVVQTAVLLKYSRSSF